MKNLLIAAIAVFTIGASAQDVNFKSKRGEYMLPEKGDWALGFSTDGIFEYLGNSFNGNTNNNAPTVGTSNTVNNGFKGKFVGKYFTKDKAAYRLVFNFLSNGSGTKGFNTNADDTVINNPVLPTPNVKTITEFNQETKNSLTEFSVGVGKEWRRGKTRLQGFYGADVLLFFTSQSSSNSTTNQILTTTTTPAQTEKEITKVDINTKIGSGFGIGAEGFIGAEYFLFPKIAIGAQYTYGVNYISRGEGNSTTVTDFSNADSLATPAFTSTVTTTNNNVPSDYNRGFTGVGVVSLNLTLHF